MKSLFLFVITLSCFAWSKPRLDSSVQTFLLEKSNRTVAVLVRYKSEIKIKDFDNKINFQKNLIRETQIFQNRLFAQHPTAKLLWIVNATSVRLTSREIKSLLSKPEVESIQTLGRRAHIIQDQKASVSANGYTYGLEKIKIPELNKIYPEFTGLGVRIGIIDTGIDAQHPDLANKVVTFRDFINPSNKQPHDDHGHGTHVAGTIAGGQNSGEKIGVAPETSLIIAKSFSSRGDSSDEGLLLSLQWMADPDGNPNTDDQPHAVSNSWNIDDSSFSGKNPGDESFCVALDNLIALGIAPVFAAGNDGPSSATVKLPAACPSAISVGATDEQNKITEFSSRGPVKWKNLQVIKPEISAPGDDIVSAEPGGDYRHRSGTSMAAPHIAGLVALIYQGKPDATVDEVKNYLYQNATDLGQKGQDSQYGYGLANAIESIAKIRFGGLKIIGQDDMIQVNADATNIPAEYRSLVDAIGITNYGCTVTHIGKGYALSAGHCFEAPQNLETDQPCSFVHVKWGYRYGKEPFLKSDCESIVAQQTFQNVDFTLLKMKTYPEAFFKVRTDGFIYPMDQITIFSHPDGVPLNWSQTCFIESAHHDPIEPNLLEYACDTSGGSSGAVLIDTRDQKIVGIHQGGFPNMNYGTHVMLPPLADYITKLGL